MASADRPDEATRRRGPERARRHGRHVDRLVRALARRAQGSRSRSRRAAPSAATSTSTTWTRAGRSPTSIPRVNYGTAGGSLAWDARGEGFYYTRYPRPGERPEADLDFYLQVYYHRLGTPESQDRYEIGKDFPRIAEIELRAAADGRYLLANVQNGDGGEFEQHLRRPDGSWTRLSRFEDRVLEAVFDPRDESLLLLSRQGAPRGRLLRLALRPSGPLDAAAPVPAGRRGGARALVLVGRHVEDRADREAPLRRRAGRRARSACACSTAPDSEPSSVPLPDASAVYQIAARAGARRAAGAERLLRRADAPGTASSRERRAAPAASRRRPVGRVPDQPARRRGLARVGDVEGRHARPAHRDRAARGAKRDGTNPDAARRATAATASARRPYFDPGLRLWLDHGGVFARREPARRRRVRRGLARRRAPARRSRTSSTTSSPAPSTSSKAGYTSPQRLAIEGGSNGGLLMGAVLTQRPELFARRRLARRHLRHAARRAVAERRLQRHRVRHA